MPRAGHGRGVAGAGRVLGGAAHRPPEGLEMEARGCRLDPWLRWGQETLCGGGVASEKGLGHGEFLEDSLVAVWRRG